MKIEQAQKKLEEINSVLDTTDFYEVHTIEERSSIYSDRSDCEFIINKENINFILRGNNKYYYAHHCADFTKHLMNNGYNHISKEEIQKEGLSFNNYSINVGYNQYGNDIKRFNSKQELLGFVIGYNSAMSNSKTKELKTALLNEAEKRGFNKDHLDKHLEVVVID